DFHRAIAFENRTAFAEGRGFGQIPGGDDDVARNQVLHLDIRTGADHAVFAGHDLAGAIERLAAFLEMTLRLQIAHPGQPGLHTLLRPLRGAHRLLLAGFADAEQIDEITHDPDLHRVDAPLPCFRTSNNGFRLLCSVR